MDCGVAIAALAGLLPENPLLRFPTSIFSQVSTPAHEVHDLGIFVMAITGGIFVSIAIVLAYVVYRYKARPDDRTEPPQVFGSTQIELAWTIIPILIIVVLFLGTARVIFAIQDAPRPASAQTVVVVGHQFWWEFRYPKLKIVTANELHVPLSDVHHPTPTYLELTSADVMHSFWVPQLAGKTDVLPNRVNEMWVDPHQPGVYLGQCAQFCGPEHAKMLLRVYVDTPAQFQAWVANQQRLQESGTSTAPATDEAPNSGSTSPRSVSPGMGNPAATALPETSAITPEAGRHVFEEQACMNCHAIEGTIANGRYGPDLTHLMSRDTIASGAVKNTKSNLLDWIKDPNTLKPGSLMPAMHLSDTQNAQLVAYLQTLH